MAFLLLLHILAFPLITSGHPDILDEDNEIQYVKPISDEEVPKYNTGLENNVSRILNSLIASHDRRIRPNYGGPPTEVNVTAHIITISAVSEVSMDYTVDLYLRQFWRDPRLAFDHFGNEETTSLTIGIDMVPDTFFPNEKKSFFHETTSHNSFLKLDNRGNVIRSIRLTVTANCPMNLHTFPLDVQQCALEIESYGYSTHDIIYHWHPTKPVVMDENVHLAHFTILEHTPEDIIERTISLSTVIISWVSFWLNREATQARVAIGVTTVLTQTTLMSSTNASLPKVSYIKSLDIFLGVCFFIVFASLLEYAAVGYLMKRQRSSKLNSQMIYYYDFDEHPQMRLANGPNRSPSIRRCSSIRRPTPNLKNGGMGDHQSSPLLSVSPTTAHRLSVAGPIPETGRLSIVGSPIPDGIVWRIRPSQVDLFSRIAFPLFFTLFHIAYWTVYLNI